MITNNIRIRRGRIRKDDLVNRNRDSDDRVLFNNGVGENYIDSESDSLESRNKSTSSQSDCW